MSTPAPVHPDPVHQELAALGQQLDRLLDTVRRAARELFVPFCVGGGIRAARDAEHVFDAGADKGSVNSAAIANPALISDIGRSFGAQAVVVAIDARRDPSAADPVRDAQVLIQGGRKVTGRRAVEWAREMARRGAGEILLTSMDRDGTKSGFDLELTRAVSDAVPVPVIASGGVGNLDHLVDGIQKGGADAVLAASIFHYGEYTVQQAKKRMAERGIPVRI